MRQELIIRDHAVFRSVLMAMSRPGTIQRLPAGSESPLQILLSSLLDQEVSLAGINQRAADLAADMAKTVGCSISTPRQADFLLAVGGCAPTDLVALKKGTAEYPENGATVVFWVDGIAPEGGTICLEGPGIKEALSPQFVGIGPDVFQQLAEINQDFPLGIDVIVVDQQGQLACIPRSTRIGVREHGICSG